MVKCSLNASDLLTISVIMIVDDRVIRGWHLHLLSSILWLHVTISLMMSYILNTNTDKVHRNIQFTSINI